MPVALLENAVDIGSWCLIKCGLKVFASRVLEGVVSCWLASTLAIWFSVMFGMPSLLSKGTSGASPT